MDQDPIVCNDIGLPQAIRDSVKFARISCGIVVIKYLLGSASVLSPGFGRSMIRSWAELPLWIVIAYVGLTLFATSRLIGGRQTQRMRAILAGVYGLMSVVLLNYLFGVELRAGAVMHCLTSLSILGVQFHSAKLLFLNADSRSWLAGKRC